MGDVALSPRARQTQRPLWRVSVRGEMLGGGLSAHLLLGSPTEEEMFSYPGEL